MRLITSGLYSQYLIINWLNIVSQYIESFVLFVFEYLIEENEATVFSLYSSEYIIEKNMVTVYKIWNKWNATIVV